MQSCSLEDMGRLCPRLHYLGYLGNCLFKFLFGSGSCRAVVNDILWRIDAIFESYAT